MQIRDFGSKMQQIARKTAPDWKTNTKLKESEKRHRPFIIEGAELSPEWRSLLVIKTLLRNCWWWRIWTKWPNAASMFLNYLPSLGNSQTTTGESMKVIYSIWWFLKKVQAYQCKINKKRTGRLPSYKPCCFTIDSLYIFISPYVAW